MGTLIYQWVLNKLGLSMPYMECGDFTKGISNGYLLGEILRKYGIISDDQLIALTRNFSDKKRLKNMKYVHKWMIEAGIMVNFEELLNISKEKPGAGTQFLYKLYFILEGSFLNTKVDTYGPVVPFKIPDNIKKCKKKESNKVPIPCQAEHEVMPPPPKPNIPCVDTLKYFTQLPCENEKPKRTVCPVIPRPPVKKTLSLESRALKKIRKCPIVSKSIPQLKEENFEATRVYFLSQALLHNQKVEQDLLLLKKQINSNNNYQQQKPKSDYSSDFKLIPSIYEQKRLDEIKAKLQAEFMLAKEMEDYDENIQKFLVSSNFCDRSLNADSHHEEDQCTSVKPNLQSLQQRMETLKCKRKETVSNAADRAGFRNALSAQMIKEIPTKAYEDLLETCMKKSIVIFRKEAELADFMASVHKDEKSSFYSHKKLEENALCRLKCIQESNLLLHCERVRATKAEMDAAEAKRSERVAQKIKRSQLKAMKIENTKFAREILDDLLQLTGSICEYRVDNGHEDLSEELLAEWKKKKVSLEEGTIYPYSDHLVTDAGDGSNLETHNDVQLLAEQTFVQ